MSYASPQTAPNVSPTVSANVEALYTGLTFSWNAIPPESIRGGGLHYRYIFQDETYTTESTSVTFRNLSACTRYEFQVQAANNAGEGPVIVAFVTTGMVGKTTIDVPRLNFYFTSVRTYINLTVERKI